MKLGAGGGCEKAAVRTVVAVPQVQVGEHQSGDTDQMAWRTGFAELESTRLRTLGEVCLLRPWGSDGALVLLTCSVVSDSL